MENLDNKDLQILDLLQRNSNYSVKEIGEKSDCLLHQPTKG
jgi:DNA-binding Lrp family transcriptional regulator